MHCFHAEPADLRAHYIIYMHAKNNALLYCCVVWSLVDLGYVDVTISNLIRFAVFESHNNGALKADRRPTRLGLGC